MSLLDRLIRTRALDPGEPGEDEIKAALLATFTIDPLVPHLTTHLADEGLSARVFVSPYNQIVQELLTPDSRTAELEPDVLILWPRLEEVWAGLPAPSTDAPDEYTDVLLEIVDHSIDAARSWGATLLFVLPSLPSRPALGVGDASTLTGATHTAAAVRRALVDELGGMSGILLYDAEQAVRFVGARRAFDDRMDAVGHIPYSTELFSHVGAELARLLKLSRRGAKKCVVVDADNTLWGGVVGEDGASHLELSERGPGHGHVRFQRYLLELRRAGLLLALCSKNDEQDVWAAFERSEMRLDKSHLATWRIGWEPKSSYLREIAEELGLGLDSFVFIDDNPVELAEVEAELPMVTCLRMPSDAAEWAGAIADSGVLDRLPPTREDLARADDARANLARTANARAARTPLEHLQSLEVKVTIRAATTNDIPRVAQLVNKTNQFNLNCRRRTEAEVSAIAQDESYRLCVVEVSDRFGDSGLVGVYALRLGSPVVLDTFLLSCRALGRRVEHAMMAAIVEDGDGAVEIVAEVCPRNEPLLKFLAKDFGVEPSVPRSVAQAPWPDHVERVAVPGGRR